MTTIRVLLSFAVVAGLAGAPLGAQHAGHETPPATVGGSQVVHVRQVVPAGPVASGRTLEVRERPAATAGKPVP